MGCGASALEQTPEKFNFFCMTLHWVDIFRLIHANPRAIALVKKCLQHHWGKGSHKKAITEQAWFHGAMDFEVAGRPFMRGSSPEEDKNAKIAICHMLEYFLADGWRLVVSSDMSRFMDGTAWFFKKIKTPMKKPATVCTLSLSNTDQLQLLHAPAALFEEMKDALQEKYSKPVQGEMDMGDGNFLIKLKGNPWASEGQEGMEARQFMLELIRRFQKHGYYGYNTANIKGTADTLFFVHHPDGNGWIKSNEYCMISLNLMDRLRLVDCDQATIKIVKDCIVKYRGAQTIQTEGDFHGTYEFKLKGNPWYAEAQDAVYSKLLISKFIEALRAVGWAVHMAVDVTCKLNDKAVFIFRKETPKKCDHFCVAPADVDTIRVIGDQIGMAKLVREVIDKHWPNGIQKENPNFYGCHEFKLKGQPFNGRHGTDELHIRSFFCFLLKKLDEKGYEPITSCDVSSKSIRGENGPDYTVDSHSWFFAKTSK